MKNLAINFLLLVISAGVSLLISTFVGELYVDIFKESGGSFVNTVALLGFIPAYVFFTPLLFEVFGKSKKYWWMGILLLPSLYVVVSSDLTRIWFYILIGLIGWGIGYGILRLRRSVDSRGTNADVRG